MNEQGKLKGSSGIPCGRGWGSYSAPQGLTKSSQLKFYARDQQVAHLVTTNWTRELNLSQPGEFIFSRDI